MPRKALTNKVAGDQGVVAHPAFRRIPDPLFPLTGEGREEYDRLARLLFNAGRLTLETHRQLSSCAVQFDNIHRAAAEGQIMSASMFTQYETARRRLGLDDLDKPIAAPEAAPTNKYAGVGFANRRR